MATYRRKGRTGILATQFREPVLAPPLPPEISAEWIYRRKGPPLRIENDWWIVPDEDLEQPDIVMSDDQFNEQYEEE